ncbi:hypothetical protein EXX54_18065 [Escherichia coli]|uniref:hypothetical protein n=1 Tax=Escherichia coli TaxID=562 RepID=UPI00102DBCE5|nr:hypothetical protein [Escherichia coli]RZX50755.1 hypothetical protein EXX54_18065 [Escherichia coli]
MKQMSLIEMDGFLKGKCIPSDLKVNETNAEYLVRKFADIESKLETALRECRSAGITIDNLEGKCAALVAEVQAVKSAALEEIEVINRGGQAYCVKDGMSVNPIYARGWNDYRAKSLSVETPATDAFLAEVRASAIEHAASERWGSGYVFDELNDFAAQLRKGVQS